MKRSKHNLSYYRLLTCDQGELVPIGITEVLPGDTVQHAISALIRSAPMNAPIMHPVHTKIHSWFVPYRLIWDDWENFITGGPDGEDDSEYPTIDMGAGAAVGSLADYLGVPTSVAGLDVSALPFRAYALVYNEWYRDQDLVAPLTIDTTSGVDATTNTALQKVAWEKDYFTTARPWPQKGPDVTIPIGGLAPVTGSDQNILLKNTGDGTDRVVVTNTAGDVILGTNPSSTNPARWGATTGLQVDLTGVSTITINLLREAFAMQKFQEVRARYGSRYTEYLRSLGVISSDARLQRPEYLGGGRQLLQISEVLQTAPNSAGDTGIGDMAGHGIGAMRSNRYRRFFEEHGIVISLLSVAPKTVYMNGLPRLWNRRVKEDFWQREFQHIGSQEILNKEVYAESGTLDGVFGYQDRYDEYRFTESGVSGEFRSTLQYWHMARDFGSPPALNASFINANPTKDIYQSTATDGLYCQVYHSIQARRLVAARGSTSNLGG